MRTVHKKHRDAQRSFPAASCALCGGELYRGELCWRVYGRTLCGDCAGPLLMDALACRRAGLREVAR